MDKVMLNTKVLAVFSIFLSMGFCEIPVSAVLKCANITNSVDFIKDCIRPESLPVHVHSGTEEDLFVSTANEMGSRLANPDACSPKKTSVPFPKDPDPKFNLWPTCTHMYRCGGCCGHERLKCSPRSEQMVQHLVMRLEYNTVWKQFDYKDDINISLSNHTACRCECRVQETDCNAEKHTYNQNDCKCKCLNEANSATCTEAQRWDEKECQCVCMNVVNCEERLYFNTRTCLCELPVHANEKLVTDKPTESTSVSTTTTTASSDTCSIDCPRNYVKVPLVSGGCRCMFSFGSSFGRRKRRVQFTL